MDALFPPGPQKSLLFGDAPHFKQNPLDFMLQSARTYGDLVHFRFGPSHAYLLTNPRDAHYVLVERHDQFAEQITLGRALNSAMGHDLFAPKEKSKSKALRRGAFQTRWLNDSLSGIAQSTADALDRWQGGDPLELLETITGQIVAATLFGDVHNTDRVIRLRRALAAQRDEADFQSPLTLPNWIPTASNRKRQRASAEVKCLVEQILHDQRTMHQPGILNCLLLGDTGETQAVEEVLVLFRAGCDSATQTVAWAWSLLATHPDAADSLQAETGTVLGDRLPTADDLPNLPYCEMILKETMRLHPPVWLVSRQAKRETRLGDYYVPSGSTIFISPYIVHHSQRYFTSPEHFLPERFGESFARRGTNYAYIPFGAGTYAQAAHDYALTIGTLVLALAAQRFQLGMVKESQKNLKFAVEPRGLQLQPERFAAVVQATSSINCPQG
ncbi:MAG: cytochrome P450 [Chloroflexota bacterium]